ALPAKRGPMNITAVSAGLTPRLARTLSLLQSGHAQRSTRNAQRIYCRSGISAANARQQRANEHQCDIGGFNNPDRDKNVTPTIGARPTLNPERPTRSTPRNP